MNKEKEVEIVRLPTPPIDDPENPADAFVPFPEDDASSTLEGPLTCNACGRKLEPDEEDEDGTLSCPNNCLQVCHKDYEDMNLDKWQF